MIKELEGKYEFFQSDPLMEKYFWNRDKNEFELRKADEFYRRCNEFTKKVFGEEYSPSIGYWISYLEGYGFYQMEDHDRGWYGIIPLGEDIDKVFFHAINELLWDLGHDYELHNRRELEEDFNNRFGSFHFRPLGGLECNRYEHLLPANEYALDKWDKYYDGLIPQEIINFYQNHLNNIWWSKEQGVKFIYNPETKKFDCQRRFNEEIIKALEELKTIHMERKSEPSFLSIEVYECSLNNGKKIRREKLLKKGTDGSAVIVYPITDEGKIILACEPRVFTENTVDIGFPAGYIEKDESGYSAARRELLEETGYEVEELIHLGSCYQDQGCSGALNHYYLALGCKKKQEQHLDESEYVRYFTVTSEELKELVDGNFITGLNTNYLILKGEEYVKKMGCREDDKRNN